MKRFFIKEAKYDCRNYEKFKYVLVSVNFECEGKSQWITLSEADGYPAYCLTDKDVFDGMLDDASDDDFWEELNDHCLFEYDGIDLDSGYVGTYISLSDNPDSPAVPLIKYLILLALCNKEINDKLIPMTVGKYANNLFIPGSKNDIAFWNKYRKRIRSKREDK